MKKIVIENKMIGEIFVKDAISGTNPIIYNCVCKCGNTFKATSQRIRGKNTDCGCGMIRGVVKNTFKIGDVFCESEIIDIKKDVQTVYVFRCKCGNIHQRTHSDFLKHPKCIECMKTYKLKQSIESNYVGKYVNGFKILEYCGTKRGVLVKVVCPKCKNEFITKLSRIKNENHIETCAECSKENLKNGKEIMKGLTVEGTIISAIDGNRALNKNNTSGHKGVSYHKQIGKWRAYITFKSKQYALGTYDRIEDAIEARKIAEKKIYGDFIKWYADTYPERWKMYTDKKRIGGNK